MTGRRPGEPIGVPANGRVLDITGVRDTDDLIEALSTRHCASSTDDPAIRLLQALITDVDQGAPPLPADRPAAPARGSVRRGARTVVVLGVTTALLATTTGVTATGGTGGGGGFGESLVRSVTIAKQAAAGGSRTELTSACRAVIVGWYEAGRDSLSGSGRGTPRAGSARPVRAAAGSVLRAPRKNRYGMRSLLTRTRGHRAVLRILRVRRAVHEHRTAWEDRGTRRDLTPQEFVRPSSLSITPSTYPRAYSQLT